MIYNLIPNHMQAYPYNLLANDSYTDNYTKQYITRIFVRVDLLNSTLYYMFEQVVIFRIKKIRILYFTR